MKKLEKVFEKEIDYHRYWKDMYEKERKLCQEADNEIRRLKFKNEKLHNYNESMTDTNLSLRKRITELEQEVLEIKADNTKMAKQVDNQIDMLRKAGVL